MIDAVYNSSENSLTEGGVILNTALEHPDMLCRDLPSLESELAVLGDAVGDCNRWLLPSWFATGRLISAIRRKLATKKRSISLQELSVYLKDQKIINYKKKKLAELLGVYNLVNAIPQVFEDYEGIRSC